MLYLFKKNHIYYYKRKIPTTRKNIVFSLETDSFEKAKFMLNSLNPILEKIFLFVKDGVMEVMDELDYIHDVIEKYKKKALIEYGELEKLRHKAYTYKTKKGKTRLGEPSKSN